MDVDSLNPPSKELSTLMQDSDELELFEDFKAESANQMHPGFRQRARYDAQRAAFQPLPSTILSSTLSEALLHTDLMSDLKYKPQACGWEDVLNCIAIAKTSYEEKGKNSKGRAFLRNGDATADVLQSLVGMIPDEKGLSVLRQGLVIIFQAWQIRIKNKEEILRQLEDFPVLLSTATETWKLYPRDERLKNAVYDIYEVVTSSLSELIQILLRTQGGSFLTRNVHRIPAVESQRIDDISNTVSRAKSALEACLDRLQPERLAKVLETSTSTLSEARATRQRIHEHHEIMMRAIADIAARQSESQVPDGAGMKEVLKECLREVLGSTMQTGLYRIVEDAEYSRRLGYCATIDPSGSDTAAMMLVTKEDLLKRLELSGVGSVAGDVEEIRRQETNVASEGRELARKITTMEQFTEWVTRDDSRLLLLDGHCKNLGNRRTTPLSVLCASLASTLAEAESLAILQYYCGHHGLDSNGLPGGPLGLIQSLLAQLLRKPDTILPRTLKIDKELYERARPDNIDNLCEIFGALFSQIERNKITLCIIDEIAEFEGTRGGWDEGMSLIAFQLRWMVHKYQGPQRLKVLMTSANKSAVVSQLLEEDDKISFRGSGLPNHSPRRLVMSSSDFSFPPFT